MIVYLICASDTAAGSPPFGLYDQTNLQESPGGCRVGRHSRAGSSPSSQATISRILGRTPILLGPLDNPNEFLKLCHPVLDGF